MFTIPLLPFMGCEGARYRLFGGAFEGVSAASAGLFGIAGSRLLSDWTGVLV